MRSFSERNQLVIGAIGLALTIAIVLGSLNYQRLPFLQGNEYSAYFSEVGGLESGEAVHV
ncbi:UNVERIFIED_CONTAM: mammalian cell entry protein, partial [Bacillus amyloliquefaciens DSM 7 = ATCC 23350]